MPLEPLTPEQESTGPREGHPSGFLHSLTGLRFYAALAVFLSHLELFHYFCGVSDGPMFSFMKGLGTLGVSLFFVLSGFVLFINYLSPEKAAGFCLRKFYVARFARIYPMFFVATLVALPVAAQPAVSPEPFAGFNLTANLTMLNSILPGVGFINIPAWTINVEAFFYALFPALALLFRGRIRRNLLLAFLVFILFRVLTHVGLSQSEYLAAEYFPPNRVLEFLAGMGLGYLHTRYPVDVWTSGLSTPSGHLLLFLLLLPMLAVPTVVPFIEPYGFDPHYAYYLYLPFSIGVIFLLARLDCRRLAPLLLVHPWIVVGGEISYAFYLLHRSVMLYTTRLLEQSFGMTPTELPSTVGLLVGLSVFAVCIWLSWAAFQWIEKPCRRQIRHLADRLKSDTSGIKAAAQN